MPSVQLVNLTKKFGRTIAIQNINLKIKEGELLTLLGPSGCGKTTTLRCIAGFVRPDKGEVYLNGRPITHLPPERRGVGLVFQNYALWPHMTIYDNLAFGLQMKKVSKSEIKERIEKALATIRLEGFEKRYPRQLSGGQQQRVALARALIIEPNILLLDEPLSNLDAQLREEMRFEVRELQGRLGITTVYVTHDQAEALVLSDRIVILNEGKIMQVGTPKEIYSRPSNKFVAGFVGITSFVEGLVEAFDQEKEFAAIKTKDNLVLYGYTNNVTVGQRVTVAIRPEHIKLFKEKVEKTKEEENILRGKILQASYLGNVNDYRIKVGDWVIRTSVVTESVFKIGEEVYVIFSPENIAIMPEKRGS